MIFHPLYTSIEKPKKFTFPFCYTPHPLCLLAAKEVQEYIDAVEIWHDEIWQGKMFGVLVVEDQDERLGYLAAYSGILAGKNDWNFFVPPIYDALQVDGYFKTHEEKIIKINHKISSLENDKERLNKIDQIILLKRDSEKAIDDYRKKMIIAKMNRDRRRLEENVTAEENNSFIKESQFMKAELGRIKKKAKAEITAAEDAVSKSEATILLLKHQRKQKSDSLQQWLFSRFNMLNALGEYRDLLSIFSDTVNKIPPSGAGECCAPKLLQYAYKNGMKPICMAEFWWGESPKTEIRRHLEYYPACTGKCKPILHHMLKGLDVEDNPLEKEENRKLDILYDDEWISIVNKPAGMLTVPGKSGRASVLSLYENMYPDAKGPIIVHRLDMATSGLIILTKSKEVHKNIQDQFKNHQIKKKYVAIIEGVLKNKNGKVYLPLRPDPLDRPRQMVDEEHGKTAVTEYHQISVEGNLTRISLIPHTGRTHQLRIHCAHPDGLNAPILGDALYGRKAQRLYLHAEEITFTHPLKGKRMTFYAKADF